MERTQTKARNAHSGLRLGAFIPSPYMNEMNGIGASRDTNILELMKAIYGLDYVVTGGGTTYVGVAYFTGSTLTEVTNIPFDMPDATSDVSLQAAAQSAIAAYAVTKSYSLTDGIFATSVIPDVPAGLSTAPQAAIAAAATTLTTNYNLATGLLGLANAMNSANTAQNDLGIKFNTLVSELVTLGLIHA